MKRNERNIACSTTVKALRPSETTLKLRRSAQGTVFTASRDARWDDDDDDDDYISNESATILDAAAVEETRTAGILTQMNQWAPLDRTLLDEACEI